MLRGLSVKQKRDVFGASEDPYCFSHYRHLPSPPVSLPSGINFHLLPL